MAAMASILVGGHGPVAAKAGNLDEILVQGLAVRRVMHFRVELDGIEVARSVRRYRKWCVGRGAVNLEAGRDFRDMIAVAHPHLLVSIGEPAVQQVQPLRGGGDIGTAKLRRSMATLHMAAEAMHHDLLAVADAKDRHAHVKHGFRRHWRAIVEH
jgi:hypothetical protein